MVPNTLRSAIIDLFRFHFQLWSHGGFKGFLPDFFSTPLILSFFRRWIIKCAFKICFDSKRDRFCTTCDHWVSDITSRIQISWIILPGATLSQKHYPDGILTRRGSRTQQSPSCSSELLKSGQKEDTLPTTLHSCLFPLGQRGRAPGQLKCRVEAERPSPPKKKMPNGFF